MLMRRTNASSLADAMTIMTQVELSDWGFKGPRSVAEYLTSIRESGVDLPPYHLQWVKTSGVNPKTSLVHEHRNLVEILRLAICRDQLNPMNCMSFELVTRRLIQLEIAVSRSHPIRSLWDWMFSWRTPSKSLGRLL